MTVGMTEPTDELAMGVGRVEAFSDGVFAVAVTLLILNIARPPIGVNDPASALVTYLLNQWPSYLSYLMAFLYVIVPLTRLFRKPDAAAVL